ncbi:MAG: hypothetical protein KTR33_14625 [Gammaproteobacteria bacterium]|nr:hypothetical protein [Gammaproteobacteria bacterium]
MNTIKHSRLHAHLAGLLFSLGAAIAAFPSVAAAAEAVDPNNPSLAYGSQVEYGIYRNNKRIGKHLLSFSRSDAQLKVNVVSDLTVTVLKIPVYRFNYRAGELWQNGQLQSVDAQVREKGKTRTVSLRRAGNQMSLTEPDGSSDMVELEYASNHWHPGVLEADVLFNTLTGKANKITIENVGTEILQVNGEETTATHYRYTGELQTEVWYDERQRWVKLRFSGSDGSNIEYRCEGFNA